ncbi:hypothetical protein [Radicibacter daui]|uniref:hypothetical protein n=1 Tax=Radicibacter daui TaxID=3064829 RepID=UPI004046C2A6
MREADSLPYRPAIRQALAAWHPDLEPDPDEEGLEGTAGRAEETARPETPEEQILTYEPVAEPSGPGAPGPLPRWVPWAAGGGALLALLAAGLAGTALFIVLTRPVPPAGLAAQLTRLDQQQADITALRNRLADLDERQSAAVRSSVELTAQLGELDKRVTASVRKAVSTRQEDAASLAAGHPTIQPGDQISVSTAGVTVYAEPNTGSEALLRLSLNDRATVVGSFLSLAETRWYQIRIFGHPRFNTGWVAERELYP